MALIRYNDRCAIIGKTGSGKTFLVERLLDDFPYVVVLDNKGFFGTDEKTEEFYLSKQGYELCTDLDDIAEVAARSNKIVYRPDEKLEANKEAFKAEMDSFFWWIYQRKNCILYIDEVTAVSDSHNILPGHNAIMKRGRQRGIGCWNGTQQPVNLHNTLLSEAEHYFVFATNLQAHRDKLAGFMGEAVRSYIPRDHKYFYYNVRDMDEPILQPAFRG